jgi:hypothetical protein
MTLRNAPLSGRDGYSYSLICISEKQKYFCKRGWTGQISLIRFDKSGFSRKPRTADYAGACHRATLRGRVGPIAL